MVQPTIFATYDPASPVPSLTELALDLAAQQEASWPQLAAAHAALRSVRTRTLDCDGFTVRLQYNPGRLASGGAQVDADSIRARPCFLCTAHRPACQQAVLYRQQFLVLCNPAPIFAQHLTVSHVDHTAQLIGGHVATLVALAQDLSPHFTVFYNGPQSGASAPDHLHFQAIPARTLPIETDAQDPARRVPAGAIHGVAVLRLTNLGRAIIVLEGTDGAAVTQVVDRCLAATARVVGVTVEPMVNVLCSYVDEVWRVLFCPRRKHRPEAYWRKGPERILISPASVDLGGLIITPLEQDFRTVDARQVEAIFREVCLDEQAAQQILTQL